MADDAHGHHNNSTTWSRWVSFVMISDYMNQLSRRATLSSVCCCAGD